MTCPHHRFDQVYHPDGRCACGACGETLGTFSAVLPDCYAEHGIETGWCCDDCGWTASGLTDADDVAPAAGPRDR
jgi:hypothetical protein